MSEIPRNQDEHPMMARRAHDDAARQKAVRTLRQRLLPRLAAGSREMYYRGIEQQLRRDNGGQPVEDFRRIRAAMMQAVPCITTLTGAAAAVSAIRAMREQGVSVRALQDYYAGVGAD